MREHVCQADAKKGDKAKMAEVHTFPKVPYKSFCTANILRH